MVLTTITTFVNIPTMIAPHEQINGAEEATKRNNGRLNNAAIRRHALEVSAKTRNGKIKRISEQFFTDIEAELEAHCRSLRRSDIQAIGAHGVIAPVEDFLTGEGKRQLCEAFNHWYARKIQAAVNAVRVGQTL